MLVCLVAAALPLLPGALACGGLVLRLPEDAGPDAAVDGGLDGATFVYADAVAPPVKGGPCGTNGSGPCTVEGLVCEFGTDLASSCDTLRICTGGTLQTFVAKNGGCPTAQVAPGAACPGYLVSPPLVDGGAACALGTICDYPQGRCECSAIGASSAPSWHCVDPGSACPTVRPRLGQPCGQNGQRCSYDACGVQLQAGTQVCDGGSWTPGEPLVCPG